MAAQTRTLVGGNDDLDGPRLSRHAADQTATLQLGDHAVDTARMEDVLDLYAEAPDEKRPVVSFDETPRQLIECMRDLVDAHYPNTDCRRGAVHQVALHR